ncbi:unnamed protein product [Urochloa humidicola]
MVVDAATERLDLAAAMADWRVSSGLTVSFSWWRARRRKQSAVRLVGALEEEQGPAAGYRWRAWRRSRDPRCSSSSSSSAVTGGGEPHGRLVVNQLRRTISPPPPKTTHGRGRQPRYALAGGESTTGSTATSTSGLPQSLSPARRQRPRASLFRVFGVTVKRDGIGGDGMH